MIYQNTNLYATRKTTKKYLDENLKKRFAYTYKFSSHDINNFFFLLQKGICPYEYTDDWEEFNESSLPE